MASIKVERELPQEFLSDIMITAFDGMYGACWYWSDPDHREPPWLVTNGKNDVLEQRWLEVRIADKEDDGESWKVDHEVLAKGIERIMNGEVEVGRELLGYISQGVQDYDAGDIDAVCADLIVQAGLFGEVVYG